MGRHSRVQSRRKPSVAVVALGVPAAVLLAAGADSQPLVKKPVEHVVAEAPPCCLELIAPPTPSAASGSGVSSGRVTWVASRADRRAVARVLPAGVAPERGLQVKTILVARAVSAIFPEIHNIGGVRPDALRWHPDGLAIDVMIPDPSSPAGIALGNQIVAFALKNADRFSLQDAIWRGVYYTPAGPQRGGYGHFDHVHLTTTGGGYPTGGEVYYR
ncbi:hypothetical protein Mycch_0342 [Mycolicibacterium chubuense NBB4]|uniref:ARB-07466-like C-terminal domain-containing protein n=1 Tax=Mycolicibacterium chubuense (strain NBB4) TaxID=710421 RepID=I4BD08_MYCCN|nr:hypothetical protein [Mycolicibacterium chubuense]AFM15165.1 hypothetical protein Mycch_0342 [Mycolicibacterium chubuense NBB4]